MNSLRLHALAVTASFFIAGCGGPRDAAYDPTRFRLSGTLLPAQIVTPAAGVYAAPAQGDPASLCCWVSPHARFRVKAISRGRLLKITLYVPDIPQFHAKPQSVSVSFPQSGRKRKAQLLSIGFNTIAIPLPLGLKAASGAIDVQTDFSGEYRPAPGSHSSPRYAAILTSVYFE